VNISHSELEALLQLSAVPGIGSSRLRALVGHFRSAVAVLKASAKAVSFVPGIDLGTAERIGSRLGEEFAKRQMERLQKSGIRLLTFWDTDYPASLKEIYDPPAFLFVNGRMESVDECSVAIVGTRQPSNYGKLVAEKLSVQLATRGITIVSGLAYGIDTVAHQNTVRSGGRTIAVLGSGVDRIYPSENEKLAHLISEHGAVVSEFPMGSGPDRANFPRRNRLIGGMSLGVIVVEAGEKSGALITASMALDQNREVFAVPGNIDSKKSIGCNALIKEGAQVVTDVEDVLNVLSPKLGQLETTPDKTREIPDLTESEQVVFSSLSNQARHIDDLAKELNLSTSKLLSVLLNLELKNIVKQNPGKLFVRL